MGQDSNIEWTHHTFNAWRGCQKVSAGCQFCYAETLSKRNPATLGEWGPNGKRAMAAESYWKQPLKWNRDAEAAGERRRVFCASLADVFEDRPELHEPRARLFDLIRQTPHLDWLLLTKRPENIMPLIHAALIDCIENPAIKHDHATGRWLSRWLDADAPANVWLGTSVENQEAADERIPHLLQVPAVVRFLSAEPLLGPVDLTGIPFNSGKYNVLLGRFVPRGENDYLWQGIDWVIVGGESGPNARPMRPTWARSLRDQCQAAGVAFHFKQWGEHVSAWQVPQEQMCDVAGHSATVLSANGVQTIVYKVGKKAAGRSLDGRKWNEFPR